jgi:hypothetical protein
MNIVKKENETTIIDVREMVKNGVHPKDELINFFEQASKGSKTEVHVPHAAQPLVKLITSKGIDVTTEHIGEEHYCLYAVKQ